MYECLSFFVILGLLSTLVCWFIKLEAKEEFIREKTQKIKAIERKRS